MENLTPQQVSRVELAIERARRAGAPIYVDQHGPVCVIAQLGALEGIPVERMATWTSSVTGLAKSAPELLAYPRYLLDKLQLGWSDPWRSEERCRERLRARLQSWLGGDRGSSWDEWPRRARGGGWNGLGSR